MQIATPAVGQFITVDMDAGKVTPKGEIGDKKAELTYMLQWMNFRTPFAKSPDKTPEACRQAVDSAPLPSEIGNTTLITKKPLDKGDVLCTLTTEGNLAMFELTAVTETGTTVDPPAYTGNLTLWKISG